MAASSKFITEWWLQRISAVKSRLTRCWSLPCCSSMARRMRRSGRVYLPTAGFKPFTLLALVATAYHGLVGALHVAGLREEPRGSRRTQCLHLGRRWRGGVVVGLHPVWRQRHC